MKSSEGAGLERVGGRGLSLQTPPPPLTVWMATHCVGDPHRRRPATESELTADQRSAKVSG